MRRRLQLRTLITIRLLSLVMTQLLSCGTMHSMPQEVLPTSTKAPAEAPSALNSNILDGSAERYDPNLDYFPDKIDLRYAEGFEVEYHNNFKVVTVLNPWRGAGVAFRYVLVQRGTPVPQDVGDALVIQVPVNTVVSLSTTHMPYVDRLGLLDRLIGVGGSKYINTPSVVKRIQEGELPEVGRNVDVNKELLLDINPELVTTLGLGMSTKDNHPQLLEAGFKVVLISDFMETTPLGRAEWIKFVALFFNREATAEEVFDDVAARYEEMEVLVHAVEDRPTAFMGYEIRGTWHMPGGNGYLARYLADAGADYLWTDDDSTGKIPLDFEAVYEQAANADYWLNLSQFWTSFDDVLAADERYANFAAFQNGGVYNNNARLNENGGNDYNESGHANPDLILADLIKIFHPHLLPDHELIYYRKLDLSGTQ